MIRSVVFVLLIAVVPFAMAEEVPRTISVQGQGTVQFQPDRAAVSLAISSRSRSLSDAQAQTASVVARVLKLTGRLGIDDRHVDTTAAVLRPEYRWNKSTQAQELTGYFSERNMTVRLEDLERLGDLVEGAVEAGVNQVSPPELYSSRARALYREALEEAARDARRNAEVLADALGAKLGEVLSVSAHGGTAPPAPVPQVRMAMAADAAETYNAGERSSETRVSVTFALQ